MNELAERFQRGLDELVQRGIREGRRQGQQQGQAMVLRRQITHRFGEETAARLAKQLAGLSTPEGIDRITDALFECGTDDEFIERMRTACSPGSGGRTPDFADRRMIEILIRNHVPEWANRIRFTTLRQEPTELVAGKTLQTRHPDIIWAADIIDGGRVLFLIELRRKPERFMPLRTTTNTALALEEIAAGPDFGPGDTLPEFVYLVVYHGDGPWSGPDRVTDLFRRSDPGRFRLVSWREEKGKGAGRPADDITALVLGLARSQPLEDMAAQVAALARTIREHGDPGLDAFMADRVRTMLESRDCKKTLRLGRAKTMDELAERFQRSLDELVQARQDGSGTE